MKLVQIKGKCFDSLEVIEDRIEHEWNLGKDRGSRSTAVSSLDVNFGQRITKTEGKLPYLVLSIIPLFFVVFMSVESVGQEIAWDIALGSFVALVFVGIVRKRKEEMILVSLKTGELFSVIRKSWTKNREREDFLVKLKAKVEQAEGDQGASENCG